MHFFFVILGLILLVVFWRVFAALAVVVVLAGVLVWGIALIANPPHIAAQVATPAQEPQRAEAPTECYQPNTDHPEWTSPCESPALVMPYASVRCAAFQRQHPAEYAANLARDDVWVWGDVCSIQPAHSLIPAGLPPQMPNDARG